MNLLKKVLKWLGLTFMSLLGMIVLAGLVFRLLEPKSYEPIGTLIDVNGTRLHIIQAGEKSEAPTLVIEGGGGLPTEFSYWLEKGLKDSMRVIRYDRAGIGHSDECTTARDPETIARELHTLLEKAGEEPPYIMMGHSLGGPYIRVFTEIYPDEVKAMFFLDATHPDHVARTNAIKETDFKYKAYVWSIGAEALIADLGIMRLIDEVYGTPYFGEGLPDEMNARFKHFIGRGKIFRAYQQEIKHYYITLARSGEVEDFGDMPIRAFSAIHTGVDKSQMGLQEDYRPFPDGKHKEYADLSSNGKQINIVGNHLTLFTKEENAAIICREVLEVVRELEARTVEGNSQ